MEYKVKYTYNNVWKVKKVNIADGFDGGESAIMMAMVEIIKGVGSAPGVIVDTDWNDKMIEVSHPTSKGWDCYENFSVEMVGEKNKRNYAQELAELCAMTDDEDGNVYTKIGELVSEMAEEGIWWHKMKDTKNRRIIVNADGKRAVVKY